MQTDKSGNPDTTRLRELKGKQTPECQAIAKAVTALQQLKQSKLSFPKMGTQF
jgi:hypothetical protein